MIERIEADGKPLVLIVRGQPLPEETTFLTPDDFNLQVGYIVYSAGHSIQRHDHFPVERHLVGTSEVLVVQRGACEIDVYDTRRELVATREVRTGDVLILVEGGHGFRLLEDTVLLEIKQGPYGGPREKERF